MEENYLYQQIAESIRHKIIEGVLKPGDRLPTIRALVKDWNCTPGTVQRAYQELANQGLVHSRAGKGTHVLDPVNASTNPHLRKALLVNRAESFLLETFTAGYTTTEIQQAISLAADRWQAISKDPAPKNTNEIRFSGSHDLALKWLGDHFSEFFAGFNLRTEFSGSLGGLLSLAQGFSDLAGTHLWDPDTDDYNDSFIRKIFPGEKMAAITLIHRNLGFLVLPGNPLGVKSIRELSLPGLTFVNRQGGSGTRVWLDIQLQLANIDEHQINGYASEAKTHSEVAQTIISGNADIGLGLQAVSKAFGLDFIPLTQERYDLVTTLENLNVAPFNKLCETLKNKSIQSAMVSLDGYDCRDSGKLRVIE